MAIVPLFNQSNRLIKTISKILPLPTICSALLFSAASPAVAELTGYALEEVTVTARKREESLQDTPLSVAAFTSNDLKARQIDTSDQLTQVTPNLQFSSQAPSSGSNASSQVFIRGIGQTEFLPTTDPGAGIYIDGVYMARSVGGTLDFADIERIEVLRGPQGTLFGRNTIGGAINIHTAKPNDEFSGSISGTLGTDNRTELQLNMNVPLSDTVFTKFSLGKRDRDGYVARTIDGVDPTTIDYINENFAGRVGQTSARTDLGDDDTIGARFALSWEPSESFNLLWSLDYNKEDENGAPQVFNSITTAGLFARVGSAQIGCAAPGTELDDINCANNNQNVGPFATNGTFPVASTLDSWGTSVTATWELENMTIKSITAYRDMEWFASRDADNTPAPVLHTINDDTQNQFSQELQFSGVAMDDRLQWLVGLYYFEEEATDDYFVQIPFGLFNTGGDVENDTQAIFSQITYDITDQLSLTAGMRYSQENKAFTPKQFTITGYAFPIAPTELNAAGDMYVHPVTGELHPVNPAGTVAIVPAGTIFFAEEQVEGDVSEVTPMLNLAYQWTDDVMTYVSYSEGFKSGGFNARNVKPGATPREFAPEFADTFEIGFKSTLFNDRLRLNGAAFTTDYQGLQFVIREDFAPIVFNAGQADIKGFELEWTFIPTPSMQIVGGVGYTDGEYKELSDALTTNPNIGAAVTLDNSMPHAPDWSASLGIAYDFDMGDRGVITPRIDWSYRSKIYFDANNTEATSQDSYDLINLAVNWASPDDKWLVIAGVTNLDDTVYRLSGNSSLHASASYAESTYARGRQWSLAVNYNY